MKRLSVVANLCIGCRECELMCSLEHHGIFNPAQARIRVEYNEEENAYHPVICRHCEEPACAEACHAEALLPDERTGTLVVDQEKCISCLECVEACPYDALSVAPDGTVLKCDLCGGAAVCVRFCSKRPGMTSPMSANPEAATALVFEEED